MKIMLVVPPVLFSRQMSPGPAYLKSYLQKAGHEVRCWDINTDNNVANDGDDNYWTIIENNRAFYESNKKLFKKWVAEIEEFNPAIVGFTAWKTTLALSLRIALMLKMKNPRRFIVFGGYLASLRGKKLFDYPQIDAVVQGEGEETLLELANAIEAKGAVSGCPGAIIRNNGVIFEGAARPEIQDIDKIPFPDFSDFDHKKYLNQNYIPIVFGRGCSWRCSFCTTYSSWKSYRSRSAENIMEEIRLRLMQYPSLTQFEICDPACNQNVRMLSDLCDRVISEKKLGNVTFSGLAQIRTDMDAGLLGKMKRAGFHTLNFGMESGSERVLKKMRKFYSISDAEKVIRDTYNSGINVVLNFIVGFPGETRDDFRQTLEFIGRNREFISNVAPGHECDVVGTEICHMPQRFDVKLPIIEDYLHYWTTTDGQNNRDMRLRWKDEFDDFLAKIEMPVKCGAYDRQEKTEAGAETEKELI
ncbi:MAG: B12-binding domain-containing radical SAM protein [Endomicrobiales bacterium]|nr:B12-binding domain-containing radical SAM protein [Endomicrobiales bacterium]